MVFLLLSLSSHRSDVVRESPCTLYPIFNVMLRYLGYISMNNLFITAFWNKILGSQYFFILIHNLKHDLLPDTILHNAGVSVLLPPNGLQTVKGSDVLLLEQHHHILVPFRWLLQKSLRQKREKIGAESGGLCKNE